MSFYCLLLDKDSVVVKENTKYDIIIKTSETSSGSQNVPYFVTFNFVRIEVSWFHLSLLKKTTNFHSQRY